MNGLSCELGDDSINETCGENGNNANSKSRLPFFRHLSNSKESDNDKQYNDGNFKQLTPQTIFKETSIEYNALLPQYRQILAVL